MIRALRKALEGIYKAFVFIKGQSRRDKEIKAQEWVDSLLAPLKCSSDTFDSRVSPNYTTWFLTKRETGDKRRKTRQLQYRKEKSQSKKWICRGRRK